MAVHDDRLAALALGGPPVPPALTGATRALERSRIPN